MSNTYTASFSNGGMIVDGVDTRGRKRKTIYQACREHNIRDPKYCEKQEHIIKGGHYEIWLDIPPRKAYKDIFGESFTEYNSKQTKKDRIFKSYYDKVKNTPNLVLVREALVTIGNARNLPDPEIQKQIYKDYLEEFIERNPNMKVIGAYYHDDEMRQDGMGGYVKGSPHLHIDYIPVAYKCKRGQKVQNSMNGALIEQGLMNLELDPIVAEKKFGVREKLTKKKKKEIAEQKEFERLRAHCFPMLPKEGSEETVPDGTQPNEIKSRVVTNLIQWTTEQRNLLIKVARRNGLEIQNPSEKREHLNTNDYIAMVNPNALSQAHALAEKLLSDVKEVDADKEMIIDWENELLEREDKINTDEKALQKSIDLHNQKVRNDESLYNEKNADLKKKEDAISDLADRLDEREKKIE